MKKLSKKFKILLIVVISIAIVFICGKYQVSNANEYLEPATFEIKESTQKTSIVEFTKRIITIVKIVIPVIMMLCPTIGFLVLKNKIKNDDLSEEERIQKNKKNERNFLIWIVIMVILACFLDMVILGEIKEPVL